MSGGFNKKHSFIKTSSIFIFEGKELALPVLSENMHFQHVTLLAADLHYVFSTLWFIWALFGQICKRTNILLFAAHTARTLRLAESVIT